MSSSPCSPGERFKEMVSLWHLWRASVLEDMGEIPEGLEEAVEGVICQCLTASKEKLEESLRVCEASLSSLGTTRSSSR